MLISLKPEYGRRYAGSLGIACPRHKGRAAEENAIASKKLTNLISRVQRGEFTRNGLEIDLLTINTHLLNSLRHLEKAGAQTEPE